RGLHSEPVCVGSGGAVRKKSAGRLGGELALALKLGVDPRRLWGWAPREFHEYVYDGDRVIGAVVTREPEFTREGIAMLLAHEQNMAEPRNQFGTLLSEATDPANQFAFSSNESPRIDFETATVAAAQEKYYNG